MSGVLIIWFRVRHCQETLCGAWPALEGMAHDDHDDTDWGVVILILILKVSAIYDS